VEASDEDRPEPLLRAVVRAIVIAVVLVVIVWGISSYAIDRLVPLLPLH
jgi:hypothetical protein